MNCELTKQAMIFAAGLGTRLRPITDTKPKALVPVAGEPLIWHVIQKLKRAGYERIVVNVHHFANQIIDYLNANNNFGLDIRISDETGALLETGGGIRHARPLFDAASTILIHNVDILSDANLLALHEHAVTTDADATLLVSQRQSSRALVFDTATKRLTGWHNITTGEVKGIVDGGTSLAFSGIHIISPRLLPLMDTWPERFSIIDFYLHVCNQANIQAYIMPDLHLMDIGKLDTLSAADDFATSL